jgi:hypothetical protein
MAQITVVGSKCWIVVGFCRRGMKARRYEREEEQQGRGRSGECRRRWDYAGAGRQSDWDSISSFRDARSYTNQILSWIELIQGYLPQAIANDEASLKDLTFADHTSPVASL